MDLQEIRMRCVEAASHLYQGRDTGFHHSWLLDAARELENWVLAAEQEALDKLKDA